MPCTWAHCQSSPLYTPPSLVPRSCRKSNSARPGNEAILPPLTHCVRMWHLPPNIRIGLYNIPLQSLHEILVVPRGIKLRLDRLLIVARHWMVLSLRLLWQQDKANKGEDRHELTTNFILNRHVVWIREHQYLIHLHRASLVPRLPPFLPFVCVHNNTW